MKHLTLAFLLGGPTGGLVAQVATGTGNEAFGWMTGSVVSVLATFVIGFMRGWWVPGPTHERAIRQIDALTAAADRRAEEDRKMLIPLLARSVKAQSEFIARMGNETNTEP